MLRESSNESERDGYILRSTTTDDLQEFLAGPEEAETSWLSPDRQHEEAWFLGLRLNEGVNLAELRDEFGAERVATITEAVAELVDRGLLTSDGETVRLTAQGRLLSNDVFQRFLTTVSDKNAVAVEIPAR
jgi:oxygen-independent coproporphyrinogen-3 oxidase